MGRQNGTGADHLAFIVEELQAELAAGDAAVGQAEAALVDARSRRAKVQRAIDALTGTTGKTTKAKVRPTKRVQVVSEERVREVQTFVATVTEPCTVNELSTARALPKESVRRALAVLRERDLVRVAGMKPSPRGRAQVTYMPMPELTDAR